VLGDTHPSSDVLGEGVDGRECRPGWPGAILVGCWVEALAMFGLATGGERDAAVSRTS
jgi:hypothetical protein